MEQIGQPVATESTIIRRTDLPFLRKWTSFGTGVGIAIETERLEVLLVSVRPNGIRVLDKLEILRYRERPAAEWGREYEEFLERHAIKHMAAVAVLPAREVISRTLSLAGVQDKELGSAMQYQLEGLHPFPEDEAKTAFARLESPNQESVAVAIGQSAMLNEYATFFEEAGVELAGFTTAAAAYYSALRILQRTPQDHFLAIRELESTLEVYAETPTHPLYFVQLDLDSERAISYAASQVRLPEGATIAKMASLLPVCESQVTYSPVAFAAALVAALPRQALRINLLTEERRRTTSRLRWVPTLALVALAVILGLAHLYFQDFENRQLVKEMEAERLRMAPTIRQVREAENKRTALQKRFDVLTEFSQQAKDDLDSLREMTRLVPPTAWMTRFDMTKSTVTMVGEIDQATEMLKLIDDSPLFANTEFAAQVGRTPSGREIFQIRTQREKQKTRPVVPNAPPSQGVVPGQPNGLVLPPGFAPLTPITPAGGPR